MSFNDIFHDYIKDIPMNLSRKFSPLQNTNVDFIHIPDRLTFPKYEYSFEAERRAREQFDKQNESITVDSTSTPTKTKTVNSSEGLTSTEVNSSESKGSVHDVLSQKVLVPCPVTSTSSITSMTKPLNANTTALPHSFHEFESTNNVFDDMQILALDDRKALQEVLMLTNSSSAQPQPSSSSQFSLNQSANNNNHVKPAEDAQNEKKSEKNNRKNHDEELRKRLLTKGYRQDIVEKALRRLPKNRLVHIEYYMKACRTIEKTGRSTIDETLPFLIQCNLSDKMVILAYSDVCANLLKMGFPLAQTFEAVAVERGDQNRALSRLLPNT